MTTVRSEHCLDTRTSLREAYRQHYDQCPGCEPLAVLPALAEVHGCRKVVTAPAGDKGFRARHDALRAGWPGNFTDQHWVEETRAAAEAAGLAVDEYVLMIAQVPHRCGRCEPDAVRVPESSTWIADELARLRRVHGSLYGISFDPLSMYPWQAQAHGTRRKCLDADSPGGLRLRIGDDKQGGSPASICETFLNSGSWVEDSRQLATPRFAVGLSGRVGCSVRWLGHGTKAARPARTKHHDHLGNDHPHNADERAINYEPETEGGQPFFSPPCRLLGAVITFT